MAAGAPPPLPGPPGTALVSEERDLCPPHEISAQRLQCQEASLPFPPSVCSLFQMFPSASGQGRQQGGRGEGSYGSGDSSDQGRTGHSSFPRTRGTERYAGQGSAAWPRTRRRGRAGSKAREGGRGRVAVGTGPRRREKRRPAQWWSSGGRGPSSPAIRRWARHLLPPSVLAFQRRRWGAAGSGLKVSAGGVFRAT